MPQDVISAIQQQSQQVTAGQVGAPPTPAGQAFQYTLNVNGRLAEPERVRERDRQDRHQRRRHARARCRLGRARRPDLQPGVLAQQQAVHRHRRVPVARRQRARGPAGRREEDAGAGEGVSAGRDLRHAVRHHQIRLGIDQRGLQDADRGGFARSRRDPDLPAGLARDAGARDHGAGDDHRRLCGDGGARLHRQYLDPVCDRARDRHRGRRRHRRGRRRRAQYREGHVRP